MHSKNICRNYFYVTNFLENIVEKRQTEIIILMRLHKEKVHQITQNQINYLNLLIRVLPVAAFNKLNVYRLNFSLGTMCLKAIQLSVYNKFIVPHCYKYF